MALKSGLAEYKNLGKISNSSLIDNARSLAGKLISAKIVSINQSGGGSNGTAQVQLLDEFEFNGSKIVPSVLPLFPNIKNYPLVNEVVLILALANKEYQNNYNSLTFYYLSPINLWNSPQVNPIPSPNTNTRPTTQNKGYLEIEATNTPNKPSVGSNTEFKVGNYFVEKSNINPLYAYEGDFIIDGRFGNSIRFGNTVPIRVDSLPNNWSKVGNIGDPITIITNGLHNQSPSYDSITENINSDKSSAYFTSTQQIPIEVASTNDYLSYDNLTPPTLPNQYTGEQVILNSGRLLFNSSKDHILLSSAKSINLNAIESINFDTTGPIVMEGSEVYLGSSAAFESAVLGDTLIDLLQGITSNLATSLNTAAAQLGNNGVPLEPLGSAFRAAANSLNTYGNQLDQAKSNIVKLQ
jgi:hypothetical protein